MGAISQASAMRVRWIGVRAWIRTAGPFPYQTSFIARDVEMLIAASYRHQSRLVTYKRRRARCQATDGERLSIATVAETAATSRSSGYWFIVPGSRGRHTNR